jgi:hypothetical protein
VRADRASEAGGRRGTRFADGAGMRSVALVVLMSFAVGCAHFTQPPPTAMVEVTDGTIVPGPPSSTRAVNERPTSKRRALLVTGGVIAVLGAVLTGVGAGLYLHGQQQQRDSEAYCSAHPDIFLCGLGDAFDTLPGVSMIGVGVPPLIAGLVITFVGVGTR